MQKRLNLDMEASSHELYASLMSISIHHNISYTVPHKLLSKADHNEFIYLTQRSEAWVTYHSGHMDGTLYVQSEQKA